MKFLYIEIDTLFYIPCAWTSPVYIPLLFALLMMFAGALLVLDRGTALIRAGLSWGLAGWLLGLVFGVLNAMMFRRLAVPVSAMGLSFCAGLTTAGAGLGLALARSLKKQKRLQMIFLAVFLGSLGGLLGHLARTMFYTSPASAAWPIAIGMLLAVAGVVWTWSCQR